MKEWKRREGADCEHEVFCMLPDEVTVSAVFFFNYFYLSLGRINCGKKIYLEMTML